MTATQPKRATSRMNLRGSSARREISLGPLPCIVGHMLRQAQIAVFKGFMATMGTYNVRPTLFAILLVIDCNPGLRQTQVATALGLKRANLVPLMRELEKRKLAKRAAVADDRRSYALYLTPVGQTFLTRLRKTHRTHEKNIRQLLGPAGRRQLLALLQRLSRLRVRLTAKSTA